MKAASQVYPAGGYDLDLFQVALDMRSFQGAIGRGKITIPFDFPKSRIRVVHDVVSLQGTVFRPVMEINASHAPGRLILIEIHAVCRKGGGLFYITDASFQVSAPVFKMVFALGTGNSSALVGMDHHVAFGGNHLCFSIIGQHICRNIVSHNASKSACRNSQCCQRRI